MKSSKIEIAHRIVIGGDSEMRFLDETIDIRDQKGNTPCHVAANNNHPLLVQKFKDFLPILI